MTTLVTHSWGFLFVGWWVNLDKEISNMIKKYGKYFWVISLMIVIRELYQLFYGDKGDITELIIFSGFTYYFWGMSVGKFKGE